MTNNTENIFHKKGKLIIVEGIDGAGKTDACQIIKKILKKYKIKNTMIREPGGTPLSEKLRNIIKNYNPYEIINTKTILLLMYAARMQVIQNIIKPALNNSIWIISDRYDLSSFAYQGGGYNISQDIIMILSKIVVQSYIPDLTIYLDIIPKHALQRINLRGKLDNIEKNNLLFFERTRNVYLKYIKKNKNSFTVNANLKIDIVHKEIKNKLKKWLKNAK
ncbi:dTMP kinase [Buchnera aphidicola]|uniref:Thymidylate kinase n=1 Tax=Buchnera aphidicola (Sarucallis kahawaluokalani) TaxID=1241878 RepID=A0A4D6YA33_9GAMM|nr:dTMP kinase [Buchnera aphidicola]QCI26032.1 dTMP kinase [Buchnera aphidicola (Sarucallis kahawaluokalani)]